MIHAKTIVADGWWSKVGSTNLNFSSLVANWEIDLVVEDTEFARQMERLFEDDISNSREVRLEGSGQRRRGATRWAGRHQRQWGARRRRRQRHGIGGHPLEGGAHSRPEGRCPSSDARACPGSCGERRTARGVVARGSLSAPGRPGRSWPLARF